MALAELVAWAAARRRPALGWRALQLVIAAAVAAPLIALFPYLFHSAGDYWDHALTNTLPEMVSNTVLLLAGVGAGTIIGGVAAAWLVTMCRFPGRGLFEWALILPLSMPAYVMAYVYTDLLQFAGPVQTMLRALTGWQHGDYWFPRIHSLGGAVLMFIMVLYPYVYLLARTAFLAQSICVIDVGRTLGCGPWAVFFRVALPLARPAIVAGAALALMEALADYGTVAYFGVPTFTTGIYRAWFSYGNHVAAAQLSVILLLFAFGLLLTERWARGDRRFHHTSRRYRPLPNYALQGWRAAAAFVVCLVPIVLGFLLPAGVLFGHLIDSTQLPYPPRYLEFARNSLLLASVAAVVAVLLAILLAYAVRLRPARWAEAINRFAAMGYAIPGSIVAVGVLIPLTAVDHLIDGWSRQTFGVATGLLLTGGLVGLVYAYCVRFLSIAIQSVEGALAKVTMSMDDAARSLGESPRGVLWRVHRPLVSGGVLTAALIVFVDVMKELPATLIVRPLNLDTLAVQVFNLVADERLAEAAPAALSIVAAGLIPVLILSRLIAASRPGE